MRLNKRLSAFLAIIAFLSIFAIVRADGPVVVEIHSPTNSTYTTNSIFINVTASSYSAIDKVIAQIDSSTNITLTRYLFTDCYTATPTINDGYHTIRIFANDSEGNSNSQATVSFTVDAAPPSVTINSPANTTYYYHGIKINATVTDTSPITSVIAMIDGTRNVTLTYSGGFYVNSVQTFALGTHHLRIFAFDSAGNVNSTSTVYFTVCVSLEDYPFPFINSGGALNMTVVVPSSSPHAPCGSAHTMDVMSAVSLGITLGQSSASSVYSQYVTMDDYISTYNPSTFKVSFTALTDRNLVIMGGSGVNQGAFYYNSLKKDGGYPPYSFALPVTLLNNGTDYLQVWTSNKTYKIEYNGTGAMTADYGLLQVYYDDDYGRYILIVSGLGGGGTFAASTVISNYQSYNLYGKAAVIKYYDSNADGYLDAISIVELVT